MPKYRFDQIALNSTEKKIPTDADKDTYLGLEHLDSCSLAVTRFGSKVAPIGEKLIMRKGDVLFGKRRAYQKKVAIAPFDGIFSAHGMVLRPKTSVVDPAFFPFFISSDYFLDAAIKISVGSLSPTINWKDLRELEFFLPDLDVQKRLAKLLWAIERTCSSYKNLFEKTDELINSSLRRMIARSPNKNTLGDFVARYSPKRCGQRDLPVLSVTKEKAIVLQDERFESTVASRDKSNYLIVPKGLIVQGIHIDEGNFGLQNVVEEGIVSPAYKIWRITRKQIVPELLEFYLRSDEAIRYYNNNFQGTTVKRRQTIRSEDLLAMPLNFPDYEEQRKFWTLKVTLEQSKQEIKRAIEAARALQKCILNKYFAQ